MQKSVLGLGKGVNRPCGLWILSEAYTPLRRDLLGPEPPKYWALITDFTCFQADTTPNNGEPNRAEPQDSPPGVRSAPSGPITLPLIRRC